MNTLKYRDMSDDQRIEWGRAEGDVRVADLAGVTDASGLAIAQAAAKRRRGLIGATRGQASRMVIEANRIKRVQEPTP